MQISHAALILTMLCAPAAGLAGQSITSGTPAVGTPAQDSPAAKQDSASSPSSVLQPALDALEQAAGAVKLEKWKGGSIRTEAGPNINSIMRDLQSTLPPLLKEADAAPGTMSKVLRVSRNIDALYDVLLRVVDGARVAAPGDQVNQLQQAMIGLEKARHTLDDRMQETAAADEKQVNDLRMAVVKAQATPVCPVVAAAPAPTPTPAPKKKVVKKKPKPPAAAVPPSTTPPAATTKPNP